MNGLGFSFDAVPIIDMVMNFRGSSKGRWKKMEETEEYKFK